MTDSELRKKIEKLKIDQASHGGSVYINDSIYMTYDTPIKILGEKINEIIEVLNKQND